MKIILKIAAIIAFVLILVTGNELRKTVRTSTESVCKRIIIKKNTEINFSNFYNYGYNIEIRLLNENKSYYDFLKYKIKINGVAKDVTSKISLSNSFVNIGFFPGTIDDNCSFKILSMGKQFEGKSAYLLIDVCGGGPSVGNFWMKEMRPMIRKTFWTTTIIFLFLLLVIYGNKIKVQFAKRT